MKNANESFAAKRDVASPMTKHVQEKVAPAPKAKKKVRKKK